jgi:hypothetical protein
MQVFGSAWMAVWFVTIGTRVRALTVVLDGARERSGGTSYAIGASLGTAVLAC